MFARLTHSQFSTIADMLSYTEHGLPLADARVTSRTLSKADYDLPYIVWVSIFKKLYAEVYLKRWPKGVPVRFRNAVKQLAQAIGGMERHPALRNRAMLYRHPDVIPVWAAPEHTAWGSPGSGGSRITDWVPFPVAGVKQMLLRPEFFSHLSQPMTRWSAVERLPADDDWFPSDEALEPFAELAASFLIPIPEVVVT